MSEEMKNMELNESELADAAGGCYGGAPTERPGYVSGLADGYLAVRSSARPGGDNQIGGLLNGNQLTYLGKSENGYCLIRAYCAKTAWTLETGWQTGWADGRYIIIN